MKNLYLEAPPMSDDVMSNLYDMAAVSEIVNYSDLRYKTTQLNIGGVYNYAANMYFTADAAAEFFVDDEPYVYGDQDGEAYSVMLGMGYRF